MDLFDYINEQNKGESPLAIRMRPRSLDEIVGQEHILGKDKLLYRIIKADKLRSVIFYGPPGTGKTSLASVIASTTSSEFKEINATASGKKEMQEVIEQAKTDLAMYGRRTILFIDEIHRFNKSQQDYLLPFVEDGTVILIGATTENPYFEVNSALISRSSVFMLRPLSRENIIELVKRAVNDPERGMGIYGAEITDEAAEFLGDFSDGDARHALNAVELGILSTEKDEEAGRIMLTLDVMKECLEKRDLNYDKDGDNHYDIISAFIKSMRGSDPDAAVYWLARMLCGGEDIKFIARRIMICASEDVGNADPMALVVATNACLAIERIGMPEAQIILAHAATYVACAPKSNSAVNAIYMAMDAAKNVGRAEVPLHLRDAHYEGSKELGHVGYKYAHDYPDHYVTQQYLPDQLLGTEFYIPSENGKEKEIGERLKALRSRDEAENEGR